MFNKTLLKYVFREIKSTPGRFLSIVLMIGLGTFVYTGLTTTGPRMRYALSEFQDKANMADLQLSATFGLNDEDLKTLEGEKNAKVELRYAKNFTIKDTDIKLEVISVPEILGKIVVKEGRLPEKSGEILLDSNLDIDKKIGDKITFEKERNLVESEDDEDALSQYTFEITGFGNSPSYLETESDTRSTEGTMVQGFATIKKEDFNLDNYQTALIQYDKYRNIDPFSEDYRASLRIARENLEGKFKDSPEERLAELKDEAGEKISDGEKEIKDARKKLDDAQKDLDDARKKLDDGEAELADGKATLERETEDGQRKIDDAQRELDDGRKKLDDAKITLEEKKKELQDGEKKLADAKVEYEDGKKEYEDGKKKVEDGEKELADGKKKLEDGKKEYEDSVKKYEDGKKKYEDGVKELEDGKRKLAQGEREYENGVIEYNEGQRKLSDSLATLEASKAKLDKGRAEYDAGVKAIEENESALNQKKEEINSGISQIESGISQAEAGISEATSGLNEVNSGILKLEGAISEITGKIGMLPKDSPEYNALLEQKAELEGQLSGLQAQKSQIEGAISQAKATKSDLENKLKEANAGLSEIDAGLNEIEGKKSVLQASKAELDKGEEQYNAGYAEYIAGVKKAEAGKAKLDEARSTLDSSKSDIREGEAKLSNAKKELDDGKIKLEDAKREIEDGEAKIPENEQKLKDAREDLKEAEKKLKDGEIKLADGEKELEDGKIKLADAEKTLNEKEKEYQDGVKKLADAREDFKTGVQDAKKKLKDAEIKLADGEQSYKDGKETFDREKKSADKQLKDAEEKINDAKDLITKLKKPVYAVTDRTDNESYYMYYDSTNRLDILAFIFPLFFYFIALLVSLTTLTRMVEEYRGEIGTLKGLGYDRRGILLKFWVYGGLSGILGGIIGAIAGERYLSASIFVAYGSNFIFKNPPSLIFPREIIIGVLIGLITGVVAVYNVAKPYVNDSVATLMRPKAPKKGSKLFIERIKPLWSRLGFIKKVTLRNMFRFKLRMFMTVFGVAGCIALLLFGFSLRHSIAKVIPEQFDKISLYDILTIYDKDFGEDSMDEYEEIINGDKISNKLTIAIKNMKWENNKGMDQSVSLIVPRDISKLSEFFHLKDSKGQDISLEGDTVVITDKLQYIIGKEIPSEINFSDQYKAKTKLNITKIANNHLGHYIFMSPETYEKYFSEKPEYNGDYINLKDKKDLDSVIRDLSDNRAVISVIKNETKAMESLLGAMDFVMVLIIFVSSLLAIVVLYNLNNINIEERVRELSTIKVLGFYPREMTEYIYRETVMLTIVAIIPGFIGGNLMHRLIMRKIIPDVVKFYENVEIGSYLFSVGITILFSLIVMIFVHRKIQKIDMVEALKGYD